MFIELSVEELFAMLVGRPGDEDGAIDEKVVDLADLLFIPTPPPLLVLLYVHVLAGGSDLSFPAAVELLLVS